MAEQPATGSRLTCTNCGYEAPVGDDWGQVLDPSLGTLTQCPECASTRVERLPGSPAD